MSLARRLTTLQPVYRPRRTVSWAVLMVFIAIVLADPWLVWHVLFRMDWLRQLYHATGGLIGGTLIANLITAATFAVVLFGWARLRPRDLGLVAARVPAAVGITVGGWLLVNLIMLVAALAAGHGVHVHPAWHTHGITAVLGVVIGQLAGNALVEEVGDRGFLLPQVFARVERLRARPRLVLAIALLISQALFALAHLPRGIELGLSAGELAFDQLLLLGHGIGFALLYLRTGNLLVVVGIHALLNEPAALWSAPIPARPLVMGFALILWLLWPVRRPT